MFFIWFISSAYLYNITGKSGCFWLILFNIISLSVIGIFMYSTMAFFGNKILKKEIKEELKQEEIDLKYERQRS